MSWDSIRVCLCHLIRTKPFFFINFRFFTLDGIPSIRNTRICFCSFVFALATKSIFYCEQIRLRRLGCSWHPLTSKQIHIKANFKNASVGFSVLFHELMIETYKKDIKFMFVTIFNFVKFIFNNFQKLFSIL